MIISLLQALRLAKSRGAIDQDAALMLNIQFKPKWLAMVLNFIRLGYEVSITPGKFENGKFTSVSNLEAK